MNEVIERLEVQSEEGDTGAPTHLKLFMDGTKPSCPITFYNERGEAVFSMGNDEASSFIEALEKLVL